MGSLLQILGRYATGGGRVQREAALTTGVATKCVQGRLCSFCRLAPQRLPRRLFRKFLSGRVAIQQFVESLYSANPTSITWRPNVCRVAFP